MSTVVYVYGLVIRPIELLDPATQTGPPELSFASKFLPVPRPLGVHHVSHSITAVTKDFD